VLDQAEARLQQWLEKEYHGEMQYMAAHGLKRSRPALLEPGTLSVISVRMDYLVEPHELMTQNLEQPSKAYISRYALGRDYHKVMRQRLKKLAQKIESNIGALGYRVFVDSAPVLEKPIAEQAGLGWIGKHTNLIQKQAGSWFFLGEIYTDIALPADKPSIQSHCGRCQTCIEVCPTAAIVAPYLVDARRCISYLTIELKGAIPLEFRPLIGNRIYGCDDCQLFCPWNRFADLSMEKDFSVRHQLNDVSLEVLFAWDEATFLANTEGSPIRRIGHERWLRNIAVALGNMPADSSVVAVLESRLDHSSEIVREHVHWALSEQRKKSAGR
jgi:epoxyqueuosine reductase